MECIFFFVYLIKLKDKIMNKEFVPYQIAVDMKSIGFNKPCLGYYYTLNGKDWKFAEKSEYNRLDDEINIGGKFSLLAPTFSQAFRFFRKKYNLRHSIMDFIDGEDEVEWDYEIAEIGTDLDEKGHYNSLVDYSIDDKSRKFKTYEEAELECLKKLIEIVKNASPTN